jgi:hypothetical protein
MLRGITDASHLAYHNDKEYALTSGPTYAMMRIPDTIGAFSLSAVVQSYTPIGCSAPFCTAN